MVTACPLVLSGAEQASSLWFVQPQAAGVIWGLRTKSFYRLTFRISASPFWPLLLPAVCSARIPACVWLQGWPSLLAWEVSVAGHLAVDRIIPLSRGSCWSLHWPPAGVQLWRTRTAGALSKMLDADCPRPTTWFFSRSTSRFVVHLVSVSRVLIGLLLTVLSHIAVSRERVCHALASVILEVLSLGFGLFF